MLITIFYLGGVSTINAKMYFCSLVHYSVWITIFDPGGTLLFNEEPLQHMMNWIKIQH